MMVACSVSEDEVCISVLARSLRVHKSTRSTEQETAVSDSPPFAAFLRLRLVKRSVDILYGQASHNRIKGVQKMVPNV